MAPPGNEISLEEVWQAVKDRRSFIAYFTVALLVASFGFSFFAAGGVNGSFTALVVRERPVESAANYFDKEYDTFYVLRAAEGTTKALVVTLRDPLFQASFPHDGQISARVLAPQMFKVNLTKAKDEAALIASRDAILTALNNRLKELAGDEPAAFRVQAADFEGHENQPKLWPNLLIALLAGLGFSVAWALMQKSNIKMKENEM